MDGDSGLFELQTVMLKNEDLKITVPRREPHGGQQVGVTETGVEVTHLPTGLKAFCDYHRSQLKNKQVACDMIEFGLATIQ
jgi:protein subunit release factor A